MNLKTLIRFSVFIFAVILTGCASPGLVKISPDTYLLARSDRGGMFGNATAMKLAVIKEANEFAGKQGKIAIPLSVKEVPLAVGRLATIEYLFRVVSKNDPEAKRSTLLPHADFDIDTSEKQVEIKSLENIEKEITRLKNMKSKGLITEEEFSIMKKKLIERY